MSGVCRPLLKWPGGKRAELPLISRFIPDHHRYFEPFFGGGSVYFSEIEAESYANDLHPDLITFYRSIKSLNPSFFEPLYQWIGRWEQVGVDDKAEMYCAARTQYNKAKHRTIERALCFWLMRELAYGGMFRVNGSGEFNVPFGRAYAHSNGLLRSKANHLQCDVVRRKMRGLILHSLDFSEFMDRFEFAGRDFMFVDPPYDTSFSTYGNAEFGKDDQGRLADRLHGFPGMFMLVCKLTPLTERLYPRKRFRVQEYDCKYRFNIKGRFSRDSRHIMVRNYEPN